MNKLFFLPAVFTASLLFCGCGNSTEKSNEEALPVDTSEEVSVMLNDSMHGDPAALAYICPCGGCPEVRETKPGNCPKCDMELVQEKK